MISTNRPEEYVYQAIIDEPKRPKNIQKKVLPKSLFPSRYRFIIIKILFHKISFLKKYISKLYYKKICKTIEIDKK